MGMSAQIRGQLFQCIGNAVQSMANTDKRSSMKYGKVSAIGVVDLARELLERGLATVEELAAIEPELPMFIEQLVSGQDLSKLFEQHFPEQYILKLWHLADEKPDTDTLGLEIGQGITPAAHGLLANWVSRCANLSDAFEIYSSNISLLNQSESWTIDRVLDSETQETLVKLTFKFDSAKKYPIIAWQRSITAIPIWGGYFAGEPINVEKICLSFDLTNPIVSEKWEDTFKCPVLFGQPSCSLWLKEEELAKPSRFADGFIRNLVSEKAKSLMPASSQDIKALVIDKIRQDPFENCNLNVVASALNMSRSTLYRKLKEAGVGFSDLLDEYRYEIWRKNENSLEQKSVEDLCETMGFKDVSSLYKLKKRWQP